MTNSYDDSLPSPEPKYSYVCWMDIMGTGNNMYQNISVAAQKILNFQILAKEVESDGLTIYPMMDGVYIVSEDIQDLTEFIEVAFENAAHQVLERDTEGMFIIRGGISFGPIVEGKDFPIEFDDEEYSQNIESLLIGPPMVEAYGVEEDAPPFGIAIHDSARSFTPNDFQYQWYKWFNPSNRELANELRKKLESYFEYSKRNSHITNYPEEKIEQHKDMMELYLPEVKLKNRE
ncbi:hypothetical protein LPA44_12090 [Halobacterium sp. KA-4]|uniref:hypothetical protein n=1 Tax=Halobacterium sp. KA-4 TaxID=2896367 RepID=UPI001E49F5D3|nr:hypothetical protein [Halobacterium sp. KA-4]MCD2200633.1 hypothetical protein [Halobacterium sp. KA-4]